jgi:hypothetical protein
MSRLLIAIFCILLIGCASQHQIQRRNNSFVRRMPQMNRIDPGRPLANGSFAGAFAISYSTQEPNVMHLSDSTIESYTNVLGDKYNIITLSNSYYYESRLSMSGEGIIAFSDCFSGGVSLDASLGKITAPPPDKYSTMLNDNIEWSLFIRFAKQYGRIGVAIRPELTAANLYGDRIKDESENGIIGTMTKEKINVYSLSIRSSSIIRFEVIKNLCPFLGFQIKSQPFFNLYEDIEKEICYGLYGGIDYRLSFLAISPFVAFPMGSTFSHFKSPISAGLHLMMILESKR